MSEANTVWIAVATHANAERQAVQNLKHQGYECYCPYTRVLRRHARRSETVHRPFFPGYLFVRLDLNRDQWRPIIYSRGVRSLVRFGDELGIVPDGVVEGLIAREEDEGLKPPPASEPPPGRAAGRSARNAVRRLHLHRRVDRGQGPGLRPPGADAADGEAQRPVRGRDGGLRPGRDGAGPGPPAGRKSRGPAGALRIQLLNMVPSPATLRDGERESPAVR